MLIMSSAFGLWRAGLISNALFAAGVATVVLVLRRFAYARLSQPCLPESCPGVSATLTTIAFDDSSVRWLETGT
jgi:hypothetical protein